MIQAFKDSTTLKLVVMSDLVLNYQWLFGGVKMTGAEYGMATAAILGVWVGREIKEAAWPSRRTQVTIDDEHFQ